MRTSTTLRHLVVLLGLAAASCDCSGGTVPPPGSDFSRWDPVAGLDQMGSFAGSGAVLQSYTLSFVKSDGTMDLLTEAYMATATFEFDAPAQPDPEKPVGAGGFTGPGHQRATLRVWQPGQWRHVKSGNREYDYKHQGMERSLGSPLAGAVEERSRPTCTPRTLWEVALKGGAPSSAVASIRWDGARYDFSISDTDVRLSFDASCAPIP